MHIMVDRSASMADDGKWSSLTTALLTFIGAPQSAQIGVGLAYFPLSWTTAPTLPDPCANTSECGLYGPCVQGLFVCGGSYSTDSCDPTDYAGAEVAIGLLPGAHNGLSTSINSNSPGGSTTPTEPAMEGAITYGTAWAQANPSHQVAIVLATDGEPTNCTSNTIAGAAAAATQGLSASPPVQTHVIGIGTQLTALHTIAQAGGTGQAHLVASGSGATQGVTTALEAIRDSADCMFQIPVPQQGPQNFSLVNVVLVDVNNSNNTQTIQQVPSAASCHPNNGGWTYDDPNAPQMIELCPATCTHVQPGGGWHLNVTLGCPTLI